MPGSYWIRLTADGKTYTQAFQVEMDPEVHVSKDDLQIEFNTLQDIARMQTAVNLALKQLPPQDTGDLARPPGMGRSETGPRLKEKLDSLFAVIDGVDAAPTAAQLRYYEEIKGQFKATMARLSGGLKSAAAAGSSAAANPARN